MGFYHQSVGNTKALILNETGTGTTHAAYYNNTSPTSSVFTVNSDASVNHSGNDMIAYCFAEKTVTVNLETTLEMDLLMGHLFTQDSNQLLFYQKIQVLLKVGFL